MVNLLLERIEVTKTSIVVLARTLKFYRILGITLGSIIIFMTYSFAFAAMPESFADLAAKVSPSVVNITTSTAISQPNQDQRPIVPKGSPLEDFFKDFLDEQNPGKKPQTPSALGSGFVISDDGYIVTNNHVIDKADQIEIELFSGERLKARVVGVDPKTDIALLKVETNISLPFVSFGNSNLGRVGDWVMAVGNPLGQGFSVSVGIISARQRELSGAYDDFIQTDAAINRGNSGGPLFNTLGEVIGVNTAILSPTGGSIGLGFSMSSNVVEPVVSQLKEFGQTRRGWLGVRIQDITEDTAQVLELKTLDGALVSEVPDGPAKDGGVMAGDVIVMFDNVEVSSTKELVRIVGKTAVNKSVEVVVIRKGQTKILKVILGQREIAELKAFPEKKPEEAVEKISLLGMKLSVVDDALKDEFQLDKKSEGLLVREILETSDAYGKGIRVGNLILIAAQKKLDSIDDFIDVIQKTKNVGGKSLLLLIEAEGRTRFIAVKLE